MLNVLFKINKMLMSFPHYIIIIIMFKSFILFY